MYRSTRHEQIPLHVSFFCAFFHLLDIWAHAIVRSQDREGGLYAQQRSETVVWLGVILISLA